MNYEGTIFESGRAGTGPGGKTETSARGLREAPEQESGEKRRLRGIRKMDDRATSK